MLPIVFAHGLEGTPHGAKIMALRDAGFEVEAPDGQGLSLAQRIEGIDAATRDGGMILAGSSYGGLAAAWLAVRHPDRFRGLLLCAPALYLSETPIDDVTTLAAPAGLTTVVIHGHRDTVVPISVSQRYRDLSGSHVTLVERDDDHRLGSSLDAIVVAAQQLSGM